MGSVDAQRQEEETLGVEEGADAQEKRLTETPEVHMACDRFHVDRSASSWSGCAPFDDWTQRYSLGKELGSGQTAVVYEAFATWPAGVPLLTPRTTPRKSPRSNRSPRSLASSSSKPAIKRRVALKKFPRTGSLMFKQELRALRAIGVHPHVLRLLESFEGPSEDILVLELCSGGDVYNMYADEHGCCMLEPFVSHLIRQLILALRHLSERGVEHRDVKPENLLLYSADQGGVAGRPAAPHLKLADFGWAHVTSPEDDIQRRMVPPSGVGSLWYASPELNPPTEGQAERRASAAAAAPMGACDMWSVGVIAYLLLLGHSPFNAALREQEHTKREAKVIRLAAAAHINRESRVWTCLSDQARDFINRLIVAEPTERMTSFEAWNHPFVTQGARPLESSSYLAKLPPLLPVVDVLWSRLDAFQRLCWITFAHAVSEPELVQLREFQMFITQQSMGGPSYLHQLAVEIAAVAEPWWFQKKTAWMDPLRLAFCYLDIDSDGVLSMEDLAQHVVSEDAEQVVQQWFHQWYQPPATAAGNGVPAVKGITFGAFTWALCSSRAGRHSASTSKSELTQHRVPAPPEALTNGNANVHLREDATHDAVLEKRTQGSDEMCQRFLDEEFDDFGFGFES